MCGSRYHDRRHRVRSNEEASSPSPPHERFIPLSTLDSDIQDTRRLANENSYAGKFEWMEKVLEVNATVSDGICRSPTTKGETDTKW